VRPDGDNLEKWLNDCMTGHVFKDDSQITWMLRSKSYTNAPEGETLVYLYELENEKPIDYLGLYNKICRSLRTDGFPFEEPTGVESWQ
jgi:hypothetical protein